MNERFSTPVNIPNVVRHSRNFTSGSTAKDEAVRRNVNQPNISGAGAGVVVDHIGDQWTVAEDVVLKAATDQYKDNWEVISDKSFGGARTGTQCFHRWQTVLNQRLKKGQWTLAEDEVIKNAINRYGLGNIKWSEISKHLVGKLGKQCRERWVNHLDPTLKKTPWTDEEDLILRDTHAEIGNRWRNIALLLPGRSENSVKNRWNSAKRRRRRSELAIANPGTRRRRKPYAISLLDNPDLNSPKASRSSDQTSFSSETSFTQRTAPCLENSLLIHEPTEFIPLAPEEIPQPTAFVPSRAVRFPLSLFHIPEPAPYCPPENNVFTNEAAFVPVAPVPTLHSERTQPKPLATMSKANGMPVFQDSEIIGPEWAFLDDMDFGDTDYMSSGFDRSVLNELNEVIEQPKMVDFDKPVQGEYPSAKVENPFSLQMNGMHFIKTDANSSYS